MAELPREVGQAGERKAEAAPVPAGSTRRADRSASSIISENTLAKMPA